MKELVEYLAKNVVENPQDVKVEQQPNTENGELFTLAVNPTDMGRIIGKAGKVIRAIRTLVKIKAIKENRRVALRLLDDHDQNPL